MRIKKEHQKLPERMRIMLRMYGYGEGQCKNCPHFERHRQASTWFKCGLTVQTGGTATDWKAKWPACGRGKDI